MDLDAHAVLVLDLDLNRLKTCSERLAELDWRLRTHLVVEKNDEFFEWSTALVELFDLLHDRLNNLGGLTFNTHLIPLSDLEGERFVLAHPRYSTDKQ